MLLLERQSHVDVIISHSKKPDRAAACKDISQYTTQLIAETGRGFNLADADLSRLDLSNFDLRKSNLNRARLHYTNLDYADLSGASIVCPGMEKTSLRSTILRDAYMHALAAQVCDFRGADLSNAVDITGALFHGCIMDGVNLSSAMLAGSTFYQCVMPKAILKNANLQGAVINECVLNDVELDYAVVDQFVITKSALTGACLQSVQGTGMVLQRLTSCDRLILDKARVPRLRLHNCCGGHISGVGIEAPNADISLCHLNAADFRQANLANSHWTESTFDEANFASAQWNSASIFHCSGRNSNFDNVQAENIHVKESNFTEASFQGFAARNAVFRDCNLQQINAKASYFYRAMFTGDPPMSMRMTGACFEDANLVQAYIAADMTDASLVNVKASYIRLNQSLLRNANLLGMQLFDASVVKTDFTGATIKTLEAPIFMYRCTGLNGSSAAEYSDIFGNYLRELERVLKNGRSSST